MFLKILKCTTDKQDILKKVAEGTEKSRRWRGRALGQWSEPRVSAPVRSCQARPTLGSASWSSVRGAAWLVWGSMPSAGHAA